MLHRLFKLAPLGIPVALLLLLSFQYPFSVSVPIGGDAPYHIVIAKKLFGFAGTPYPLSSFLFGFSRILPTSWLFRFTFFMAFGYAISGFLLAILLHKISGRLPAILGIIFWSISTWDILPFYRDGTMAQLWSIPFLILLFYAILNNQRILFGITLICIYFAHPATFAPIALILVLLIPFYLLRKINVGKYPTIFAILIISALTIFVFNKFPTHFPYASTLEFTHYLSLKDFLETRIGIMIVCAPLGFIVFSSSSIGTRFGKIFLMTFSVMVFFSTFNSMLGIGAWERRFVPYFVVILIFFGSLGLTHLLRNTVPHKSIQYVIILFLVATLGSHAWFSSQGYYRIFNGDRSSLHESEKTAYEWIDQNLPKNSVIVQKIARGRGIEWLPVFANRETLIPEYQLNGVNVFSSCNTTLQDIAKINSENSYVLFHTWTEKVPGYYQNNSELFPLTYENNEVKIYRLPAPVAINQNLINQCQE